MIKTAVVPFYSVTVIMFSWCIGLLLNYLLATKPSYKLLSEFNWITSNRLNRLLGVDLFRLIVIRTAFRWLNTSIALSDVEHQSLINVKQEILRDEISDLIRFVAEQPTFLMLAVYTKSLQQASILIRDGPISNGGLVLTLII